MSPVRIPPQNPAVVLRSHYTSLRGLLAIVVIATVCLSLAVVVLATNGPSSTGHVNSASPAAAPHAQVKSLQQAHGGRRP